MINGEILIINPWIYDFKGYDEWAKPMGLLYVASVLRNEGYGVSFLNCLDRNSVVVDKKYRESQEKYGCGKYPSEEVEKPKIFHGVKRKYKRYGIRESDFDRLARSFPRPVCILAGSLITFWYEGVFNAIKRIKTIYPDVPVVLGGIYASLCYEHAKLYSGADFVVRGHDLDTLLSFLSRLSGIAPKKKWNGFSNYPIPAYDLLSSPSYLTVMSSMGCPFRCSYCASSLLNGGFSVQDPISLAEKLAPEILKLNITDVAFYDDALLVNYDGHMKLFLDELKRLGVKVRFHTPNAMHAKYLTYETALHLMESGFVTLRLGFEFIEEETQYRTGNKTNLKELESAASALYKAGFKKENIKAYLLAGTPGTKALSIERAVKVCASLGLATHISEYSPIPGTPMWKEFPGSDSELSKDPLFHNNTYHIYSESVISLEEYDSIKSLSRKLNGIP